VSRACHKQVGSGVWFLRRGQQLPPHQLGVWGSAVSSHSGARGGVTTAQRFSTIFALRMATPDTIMLLIVDYHAAVGSQVPTAFLAYTPGLYRALNAPVTSSYLTFWASDFSCHPVMKPYMNWPNAHPRYNQGHRTLLTVLTP